MDFSKYDLVIFDLDDTIFSEFEYLDCAYNEIATYLSEKEPSFEYNDYYSFLKDQFKSGERINLFDKLINIFKLQSHSKEYFINDFLSIMRTVDCKKCLKIKDGLYDILLKATIQSQVCIVTNGNVQQQQNKVRQINWRGFENDLKIYYANEIEPKPSNKIFLEIIKKDFKLFAMDKILMIGDSEVDKEFAMNINAEFRLVDCLFE